VDAASPEDNEWSGDEEGEEEYELAEEEEDDVDYELSVDDDEEEEGEGLREGAGREEGDSDDFELNNIRIIASAAENGDGKQQQRVGNGDAMTKRARQHKTTAHQRPHQQSASSYSVSSAAAAASTNGKWVGWE